MQLLKALVIGMGVLIIVAIGLLAYGLLTKTTSPLSQAESPFDQMTASETGPLKSFGDLALAGNAGCRIESATPDGRRLVIVLAPAMAGTPALDCEKIVIIDMSTGALLGGVVLEP